MRQLLKRITLGCALAFAVLTPTVSFADDTISPTAVASESSLTVSPLQWSAIVGSVLPFLIWLATKSSASSKVKVFVTIVAATLASIVQRAVLLPDGSAVVSAGLIFDAILVGGVGQWVYKLFKDGKTEKLLLPTFGIG